MIFFEMYKKKLVIFFWQIIANIFLLHFKVIDYVAKKKKKKLLNTYVFYYFIIIKLIHECKLWCNVSFNIGMHVVLHVIQFICNIVLGINVIKLII